jgi:cytochrome c oxidase subunit II
MNTRAPQSMLEPAGPMGERFLEVYAGFHWVLLTVYALVGVAALTAVFRSVRARRRSVEPADAPTLRLDPRSERRMAITVGSAVALTTVVIFGLLIAGIRLGYAFESLESERGSTVKVVGHQWWWEVHHEGATPGDTVITANEIHFPIGVTTRLRLVAQDVIHSFWLPALGGKRDLIPGLENELVLRADREGVFRGQCAEFCGLQHAHMAFVAVAEPRADYDAWLAAQRRPAAAPTTPEQLRGREVFLEGPCVLCHTIRGTAARGTAGPDLTHFASRRSIGAGIFPNEPGYLAGWITDSHSMKPGNHMPPVPLAGADLNALIAYLGSLR